MLGSIPARSILLFSLLALSACAAVDARSSTADPSAPTGVTPLTWLQAAAGIEDYVP